MPGLYPLLSFSKAVSFKYPNTRTLLKPSVIATFCDFSEQRWNKSVADNLYNFEFNYRSISTADKETLRNFYGQQGGEFATDWRLIYDSVLYTNCQFIGPFIATSVGPKLWDVTLRCRALQGGASASNPSGSSGGTPVPLPHGAPNTATLYILTSHIPATGITLYTGATVSTDGLSLFSRGFLGASGDASAWTLRTDSTALGDPTSVYGLSVDFAIGTGIPGTSVPPAQFLIYDAWVDVVYADGTTATMRPSSATVNTTLGNDGTISNPGAAADGDPSTAAIITRSDFTTLDFSPVLILSGFV
jgi:hypothetical protein